MQRTGEAETITTHYIFALGAYRAFYIPNWIYRYYTEHRKHLEPIAIIAGILQTVLYSDFFWIYYTRLVHLVAIIGPLASDTLPFSLVLLLRFGLTLGFVQGLSREKVCAPGLVIASSVRGLVRQRVVVLLFLFPNLSSVG